MRWVFVVLALVCGVSGVGAADYTVRLSDAETSALQAQVDRLAAQGEVVTPGEALQQHVVRWLAEVGRQADAQLAPLALETLPADVRQEVLKALPSGLRQRATAQRDAGVRQQ